MKTSIAQRLLQAAKLLATSFKPDPAKLGKGDEAYDLVYRDYVEEHPAALDDVLHVCNALPFSWLEDPHLERTNSLLMRAKSHNTDQRYVAAGAEDLPMVLLELLANDQVPSVREKAAGNENITADMLETLARDLSPIVREAVATNPKTPCDTLVMLTHGSDARVLWAVAANQNTPGDTLDQLSMTDDVGVLWRVAANPSTLLTTLKGLSYHYDNPLVLKRVRDNLQKRGLT